MNLKLGKSFPVLKFKPNILEPIRMDLHVLPNLSFEKGVPIHSFADLLNMDFFLTTEIEQTKLLIKKYISAFLDVNIREVLALKEQLKKSLENVIELVEKLDFDNIEKNIAGLFQGCNGLCALFRYVWSVDLLRVVMKIKATFELKGQRQRDSDASTFWRKGETYQEQFEQIIQKQGRFILKQFVQQMYLIPEQWGCKLMKKNCQDFDSNTLTIIKGSESRQWKLKQLLGKFASKQSDQTTQYKNTTKALFYFELENQFYTYINVLKSILLSNASGIFNGDFETWSLVYQICLKIYARKPTLRGKQGIEIDQIIQHPAEDPEFTNFLQKCNPQSVSMGSINFYYKNCPKSAQINLQEVAMRKIKSSLESKDFKEYEDIIQFLETESQPSEKQKIVELIRQSWIRMLGEDLSVHQFQCAAKNLPDLIQYLVKNPQNFYEVVGQELLGKMLSILLSPLPVKQKKNYHIQLIYTFINTLLIQAYEQQFGFHENAAKYPNFTGLIADIVLNLKSKHKLQVHEDGVSIILDWSRSKRKTNNSSDSQNEETESRERDEGKIEHCFDLTEQVATLMLTSGRDCDFKLEQCFQSENERQLIAQHLTLMFKVLSDNLFEERIQIEKFLESKRFRKFKDQEKSYIKSYLVVKGLKDKLIHENLMNLAIRMNPVIGFIEISTLALQFLTFTTPTMIDDPIEVGSELEYASIQPFDICDIVSGEEPIECMKLIYNKLSEFQESSFDFQCLEKMPLPMIKQLGSSFSSRSQLANQLVETDQQLTIGMLDRFEEFRKFLFYAELMTKVFSKLNEKSQKGIKEIKVIYACMEKVCYRVWQTLKSRILSSEVYHLCRQSHDFQNLLSQMEGKQAYLQKQAQQYYQLTFNKLIKTVKLPYIDSILSQTNYLAKTCHDLICHVSKALNPTNYPSHYQKLFNPLEVLSIESFSTKNHLQKVNYDFLGEVITFLAMIQFTMCIDEDKHASDKEEQRLWSSSWRKNCRALTQSLLQKLQNFKQYFNNKAEGEDKEKAKKNLWVSVFLVHLKAEITKILIPFLIKEPLKYPAENPKIYHNQLQETFFIFSNLCGIVENISQGEQEHLMSFLEIFENYDAGSNNKNIHVHAKIGEYLYKAIESLLQLVFKGIRVRSYHFYKFIRSYLRLARQKQNYVFFNSVIAFYIQSLMTQIVPDFQLPESVLSFCDQNINSRNKVKLSLNRLSQGKEMLINEGSLKKNVNQIRFSKFVRFKPKFQLTAEKVCAISMFVNLFCRLNFKTLTQGIERIWSSEKMRLIYLAYLQKITRLVSQEGKIEQKLFDIINVDCFGNLPIILRFSPTCAPKSAVNSEYWGKIILSLLKLIQQVRNSSIQLQVRNSLTLPVKKILAEIKSSSTSNEEIDYISETIQRLHIFQSLPREGSGVRPDESAECPEILDMVITCYNMKLARDIRSNIHLNNLLCITKDSDLKLRTIELNMGLLEKRMNRKDIRGLIQMHDKIDESAIRTMSRKPNINGVVRMQPLAQGAAELSESWVRLSRNSEHLILQLIQDFINSFTRTFREHISDARSLFNSLKILSLVAVNNPEVVEYLLTHKSVTTGLTVYDVMVQSSYACLPIFVELYTAFMKTNLGFWITSKNSQSLMLPNNLLIEKRVKQDLLQMLQQLFEGGSQVKLEALLKCLNFLALSSRNKYQPHFRIYKFGNINNKALKQYQSQYEIYYHNRLINILKAGIEKLSSCTSTKMLQKSSFQALTLFQQTLNQLLKQNDQTWMKLNLDITLTGGTVENSTSDSPKVNTQQQSILELGCHVEYKEEIASSEPRPLVTYEFESEVIGEDSYALIYQLGVQNLNTASLSVLKALDNYSVKHTGWEGLDESEATLMLYPPSHNSSPGRDTQINEDPLNGASSYQINSRAIGTQIEIVYNEEGQTGINFCMGEQRMLEENQTEELMGISKQASTRSRFYQQHNEGLIQDSWENELGQPDVFLKASDSGEAELENDGVIEQDDIVQDGFLMANQLDECMSQTSLQFLSQHSVKYDQSSMIDTRLEYSKQHLVQLYEQSVINPEARKLLLAALSSATAVELEKFINNQAVDEEVEMLAVRELWGRGVVPSATSISKNSRYYGNLVCPSKNLSHCLNSHINQALAYKKMYQSYAKLHLNPTLTYIPQLPKAFIQKIMLSFFGDSKKIGSKAKHQDITNYQDQNQQKAQNPRANLWRILRKFIFRSQNMKALFEICLKYLGLTVCQMNEEVFNLTGLSDFCSDQFRRCIFDDVLCGCIRDKVGLKLLFTASWDAKAHKLFYGQSKKDDQQSGKKVTSLLEFILSQTCLIDQTILDLTKAQRSSEKLESSSKFVHVLWSYLQNCDEFKAHSKIETKLNPLNSYPYYELQQSLQISQQVVIKIVDKIFAARAAVGVEKGQASPIQELLMVLVYLDPNCFEYYFKAILGKMSPRLRQIIKKQHKILAAFQSNWKNQTNEMEMEKEEKYWNLRQNKKATQEFQQNIEYFRNLLVDLSINLLDKFKKLRFNYHCGQQYREWKLEIEILRQKLIASGSVEGLLRLDQKEKDLQNWKRNENNQIISQQIVPLVEHNFTQFIDILAEAEEFISEFLDTFDPKQQKDKIVIFNTCSKLYEILLACDILTHQEKITYHSMSNLKTVPTIDSAKSVRRSTKISDRKSARLSITPCMPRVENLLRMIGSRCTFLSTYLGPDEPLRQLHAKYSDVNKRLKILWAHKSSGEKPLHQKVIECRRTHIVADTLAAIDQDFINLKVKVKFEGEIGIDYGGVTQQWVTLFIKQIVNPDLGLFTLSANNLTFQPNRNSHVIPNHLRYFRKMGILVGKAMKQNWLLEINLAKSFLKHLLGSTLYVEDLEDIDPETAKSLKWILENEIGDGEDLGLNFTYETERMGIRSTIELIPNGASVVVEESNKKTYVKLLANMKMTNEIKQQSKAFMGGLEAVIPYSTLRLFSYKQISLYLSGMPSIDLKEMEAHARYENLTAEQPQIVWFWSIISGWSQQELANLLFFLTGSYRVPYGGFKQHPIGFNKVPACTDYLPVAHTCFSILDISSFSSKQKMQKLLIKSIKEGKGFSVS